MSDMQTIIRLINLLEECREVLDNYSDGEYVDGKACGNAALRLVGDIDDVLQTLGKS